jgi:hypothetical protein
MAVVYNLLQLNDTNILHTTNQGTYNFIKYDKTKLYPNLYGTYGLYRSVILNSDEDVVSFSPPKSISYGEFSKRNVDNLIVQELVEGTMINVFFDNEWQVATRNTIDKSSKFSKMFFEAAQENGLVLDKLETNLCYSFVLQHPNNVIVGLIKTPQLYLIAMYSIDKSTNVVTSHDIYDVEMTCFFNATTVKLPQKYEWAGYESLIDYYCSTNLQFYKPGVVILNTETGERTKIRNTVYEQIKRLKGGRAKLQYQYFCLRQKNQMDDFLKSYPENSQAFLTFEDELHEFTCTLYKNYASHYVKKEAKEIPPVFKAHMYNIHKIYKGQLKDQKKYVTREVVVNYVNEMTPSSQMYTMSKYLPHK